MRPWPVPGRDDHGGACCSIEERRDRGGTHQLLDDIDVRVVIAEAREGLGGESDLVVGDIPQGHGYGAGRHDEQVVRRHIPGVHGLHAPAVTTRLVEREAQG